MEKVRKHIELGDEDIRETSSDKKKTDLTWRDFNLNQGDVNKAQSVLYVSGDGRVLRWFKRK